MSDVTETIRGVWDSYDDEEYRRDQSHWRGHGRWANDEAWRSIGNKSLDRINRLLALTGNGAGFWSTRRTFLEWGPGGGANLFAFHRFASTYYGVDISQKNLDEASRMIGEEGFRDFRGILLGDNLDIVPETVGETVDLFLSTAVFQHFPSKQYGVDVLATIARCVKKGGFGFIQIRFDNGNERFRPIESLDEYKRRHITANSYKIDEFWGLCAAAGLEPLSVYEIMAANNYATFLLKRVR
jgi:hypothetical protein